MSKGQIGRGDSLSNGSGTAADTENSNVGSALATLGGGARARGGGAPDRAVVSVCDLCNMRRADLKAPCGHKYHARCIFAMPIIRCPVCDLEFPSSNEGGLLILPVEPFSNAATYGGIEEAEQQTRTGRWHSFETMYAQRIVADFEAGTLPLCDGTKLGTLLCNILNCSPSRLSKKLKIGKKCFQQRSSNRPMNAENIARHREAQKRLSDLEEMFLMAESRANRGMVNAEVLSECIQKEWRERLVEHALAVNQRLKNSWDWNSTRKRAERRRAEISTDALNKLLSTMPPTQSAESPVNHLSPLFLVNHHADGGGAAGAVGGLGGATGDGAGGAGSNSQQMQNAVLAQAMAQVLQSWQQGQCVPASDLLDPDLPAWQQGLQLPPEEAFRGGTESAMSRQHGQLCRQAPDPGGQAVSPETSMINMEGFIGGEQLLTLEQNLASLGYKNSAVIEMDQKPPFTEMVEQWPQADQAQGGREQGSPGEKNGKESAMSLDGSSVFAMDVGGNNSSAGSTSNRAAATSAYASSEAPVPGPIRPADAGGGSGAAAATAGERGQGTDGDGDVAMADDHRFEDFIANFLDQVPFEAVDVWVPLCDRDEEGSEVVLFHAGYFTNVRELDEWGDYSTNFSFRRGQGIPGRVFGSNESEYHENVGNLDLSMFLRLNGARKIGIGTSFALPVVSKWGVTFVIVFYTRETFQLDAEKKVFIENMVRGWELDATVDTADDKAKNSQNNPSRVAAKNPRLGPADSVAAP